MLLTYFFLCKKSPRNAFVEKQILTSDTMKRISIQKKVWTKDYRNDFRTNRSPSDVNNRREFHCLEKSVRYFVHKNWIFTDFLLDFHENKRILARGVTISFRSEMEPVNNKNLKNLLEAVEKTFLPPTVRRKRKFQRWEKFLFSSFVTCSSPVSHPQRPE